MGKHESYDIQSLKDWELLGSIDYAIRRMHGYELFVQDLLDEALRRQLYVKGVANKEPPAVI